MVKRYSAAIMGGSNSVMNLGYWSEFLSSIESKYQIKLEPVHNMTVGATRSLMAATQLASKDLPDDIDYFFIEYSLNDESWEGSRNLIDFWMRVNEGIVRSIKARWPNAMITLIILSRQRGYHRKKISMIHAMTYYIARHYGCVVADVHDELYNRLGDGHEMTEGFYSDNDHYSRGVPCALVGEIIADAFAGGMDRPAVGPMPRKLVKAAYDRFLYVDHRRGLEVDGGPTVDWSNSRFSYRCVPVSSGRPADISYSGEMLAVDFISHPDIPGLAIEWGGKSVVIPTYRRALGAKYAFLVSQFVPMEHGLSYETAKAEPETVRLKVQGDVAGDDVDILKAHSTILHAKSVTGVVPVIGVLLGQAA